MRFLHFLIIIVGMKNKMWPNPKLPVGWNWPVTLQPYLSPTRALPFMWYLNTPQP